ncbi:hypothetical protein [Curtobacterium sp. MCBD17_023]|uniref:hypothetical protein n=1 Tax=Curtobacterium sp. MCBD17_023 TaxID=2175657 RepID=UPI000D84995A|nr:hypothetical protein [Curtobacterium sp. MCBD17_023]PYY51780.1 hypothetical protein DEI84_01370 [Curtobacterium sp. MCBD17_023]
MGVEFDDAAAGALIRAAQSADGAFTGQSGARRGAVETAMQEFRGGYAELFRTASVTESSERGRLARAMDDLAQQVERAKQQAAEENRRLDEVRAWEGREADRDERRRTQPLGPVVSDIEELFDPRPSEPAVRPSTISVAFTASQRTRTSSGNASGTSSAKPDALRSFATQSRSCNTTMRQHLEEVADAWTRFTSSSSWVPVGGSGFLDNGSRFVDENEADVTWMEHVAAAFEHAGSGTLTNHALDLAVAASLTTQGQDPVEVLRHMDADVGAAWLAAHPEVLDALVTTPPAWGTPSTVYSAIVQAERARGADPVDFATVLQRMYVSRAAEKVGIDMATWDTGRGAQALLGQVTGSYQYYAQLYLDNPDFTWAGMANMVGPDFAAGFLDLHSMRDHIGEVAPLVPPSLRRFTDQLAGMGDDEIAFYEKTFLGMQRDIFLDASTMHEAYLDGGIDSIDELAAAGLLRPEGQAPDDASKAERRTLQAWRDIDTGIRTHQSDLVDDGNTALLYREQHDTIQRSYDEMRDHEPTGKALTMVLGVVGDASIPGTRTLGQYEGGISVPVDLVPGRPGVQGSIETWNVPRTNISEFDVRWDYIENDTLPAWQQLVHDDPERARDMVGDPVPDRIDNRRLDKRLPGLVDDLHDTEFVWQ